MKNRLISVLTIILIAVLTTSSILPSKAAENEMGKPFKIYTTAYYYGEITASGAPVREGIAAAKKEWMGLTAIIYRYEPDGSIGEVLGIFEILDTGFGGDADGDGIGSIQEGKCIDIYRSGAAGVQEWMELTGGKVYVQLINAKG